MITHPNVDFLKRQVNLFNVGLKKKIIKIFYGILEIIDF